MDQDGEKMKIILCSKSGCPCETRYSSSSLSWPVTMSSLFIYEVDKAGVGILVKHE
jgi:hypothetical protein